MRHSIVHTAGNVVWAARHEGIRAVPLVATYSRLKFRELLSGARRDDRLGHTRVLGMPVGYFDDYWLVEMYEEIFLREQYSFECAVRAPIILDVGSNIGLSILYFKTLFPEARVIAFEPDPRIFEVLSANVRENGLRDVELVNEAVYDGTDSVELYGDAETPGSPQASTRPERMAGETTQVRSTRLSAYVTEPVDFLKLDIEGAELLVLRELEESGRLGLVERMAVEYHHHLVAEEDLLSEMLSMFERNGFGYQLEARLSGPDRFRARGYQNILVHAYRKEPAGSSVGTR